MNVSRVALVLAVVIPCAAFAQGGGGGGGSGGGSAGGAGGASGAGAAASTSPSSGAAGTAATGANGSASTTAPALDGNVATGTVNGLSTGQPGVNQRTDAQNGLGTGTTPGTNTAGTASPSGAPAANAQNTAPAGGVGRPTRTKEQDSDPKIDQENNKADRTVGQVCKNC